MGIAATVIRAERSFETPLPECLHFIGGGHVRPAGHDVVEIMDPARGIALSNMTLGSPEDVDAAVAAARGALNGWAGRTPRERSQVMLSIAGRIEADAERLGALEALNCGKPASVVADDVESAIDVFRFMAGAGRTGSTIPAGDYLEDTTSLILREPVGVVGLITPWNYPLLMASWKLAAALMAGNTVVFKPSEVTPLTALRLVEITEDLLPPGVLNVLLGDGAGVGASMSGHPGIDMMALTGSVRAGSSVAATAAADVKRVHLELGGKAPVIVCADADLDVAAAAVAEAGFWNSGQECGAACRVIAHDSVVEDLGTRLRDRVGAYVLADPEVDGEGNLGPMIYGGHHARVMRFLGEAVERGAEVLLGGQGDDSQGYWIEPTILRVQKGDPITETEVFGPVVTIETFADLDEAVQRSNATRYGLTASVFTRDVAVAVRTAKALDFGSVNVNTHLALPTEMPWAGFKHSGYGRDLSAYAIDDFTRTKHIAIHHADN